ncbi:MAG: hypothetical protein IMZ44_03440 [Planctomycetes bacterium]|nr:hypothetical protein [Planctomycetota bacterium]
MATELRSNLALLVPGLLEKETGPVSVRKPKQLVRPVIKEQLGLRLRLVFGKDEWQVPEVAANPLLRCFVAI